LQAEAKRITMTSSFRKMIFFKFFMFEFGLSEF
jgi:hypothetical protein